MEQEDRESGLGVKVIARAARVLRVLDGKPEGLSLGQIAKEVGLARSTVQRIVAALANEDFVVEAQPGRGVRIGPGLARLAASLNANFSDILRPYLIALRDEVEETVDLSILSEGSCVFVDQFPGKQRLVALSGIGERFPLHCTANGKAMLSCFAPEDAAALIDRSMAEHPTIPLVSRSKLNRELAIIRKQHYAYDLEEHGVGISAVGIALIDAFGRPVAISIPAPSQRFDLQRDRLRDALMVLRKKVQTLIGR